MSILETESGHGGWEKTLLPPIAQTLDHLEHGRELPPWDDSLAWPITGAKDSSHNHEGEAFSLAGLLSLLHPTLGIEKWDTARAVLILALRRELQALWGDEQFCPDPHSGQELILPTFALLIAVIAGDSELLTLSEQVFRANVGALLTVATPRLEVWSAGLRSPGPPKSSVATEWLRELLGLAHGPALKASKSRSVEDKWADHQYLAVRCLRYLGQRYPDALPVRSTLVPAATLTRWPMTVWRWGGPNPGHLSVLEPVPGVPQKGVCDWCLVDHRTGAAEWGLDWKTPRPNADARPNIGRAVFMFGARRPS